MYVPVPPRASRALMRPIAVALVLVLVAPGVALGARPARPAITGTITVNGCTPAASDLTLRARYVNAGFHRVDANGDVFDGAATRSRTSTNRTATIAPTADPHVFAFSIPSVEGGRLYQLAVQDRMTAAGEPFGACGDLFWQGPTEAFARVGDGPLALVAFAARTQLEIMRPGSDEWVGSDHLDLADPDSALRSIRWRTSLPAVQAGELQVSTVPFPVVGEDGVDSCAEPEGGIVYRQTLETAESEWLQPPQIDFAAALAPARAAAGDGSTAPVTAATLAALETGAPLWLRVIPWRQDGPACDVREDGVHGWVNLAKLAAAALEATEEDPAPDLSLGSGHAYNAPFFDAQGRPFGDQYAYLVTKAHQLPSKKVAHSLFTFDPLGSMLVRDHPKLAGTWLYPGDYIVVDPGEPGWWDDFTDSVSSLVTGAIDAIGFVVNQVSKAYAEIKKAAIKVALDTLLAVPVVSSACTALPADSCRKAVEIAVDTGLAAVGMPPSLPNWNELQDLGVDYVAAQMASQTGLPPDLTEAAARQLAQEAVERIGSGRGAGGPFYDWVAPYFGFDPAVLIVGLHKTGGDLPPLLLLRLDEDALFLADSLVLPAHWSGDLAVPMVLRPNTTNVAAPVCKSPLIPQVTVPCGEAYTARWYRNAFRQQLTAATCANVKVGTQLATIQGAPPYLALTTTPSTLAVSMFALLDEPAWDYAWPGKFFGICST